MTQNNDSTDGAWNEKEMELAYRRKESWLDNRGRVVTWFVEPWPGSFWLGSCRVGLLSGAVVGFLMAVVILG